MSEQQVGDSLEAASERLEQALEQLEARLSVRLDKETELQTALDNVRAENQRLRALTQTAAGRIDGVIGKLQGALES